MASSSTSSVPIPARHQRNSSSSFSSPSSSSSISGTPARGYSTTPSSKGKEAVLPDTAERIAPRRPSLLGTSLSEASHTVINLSPDDEGPPRLVCALKSSQGFDWNQELFLPSYAHAFDAQQLEHKQDPVHDIVLSDEDAAEILPK